MVSTATAVRCSQMTLPPSFSAESEMEGWVEGGGERCSEERLTGRKVERQRRHTEKMVSPDSS